MSSGLFTCKKCHQTKPLEGFYTNSKKDKNKPYQLICRKCYQSIRKARETGSALSLEKNGPSKNQTPAVLICTIEDFHTFLDDNIKNAIPYLTRKDRLKLKQTCPQCFRKVKQLDSAHVLGLERPIVIDSVLKKYIIDEKQQIIKVDLQLVIPEIIKAHLPIEKHFKFLCRECHSRYDRGELKLS